jgi:hypothetical protein
VIFGVLGFWLWLLLMVSGPGQGTSGLPDISGEFQSAVPIFFIFFDFTSVGGFSVFLGSWLGPSIVCHLVLNDVHG